MPNDPRANGVAGCAASAIPLRPNVEAAIEFLVAMRPDLLFTLSAGNKDDPDYGFPTRTFHGHNQRAELFEWIVARQSEGANVYWTPNPLLRPMDAKPAFADIASAWFLFVDLDPVGEAATHGAQRERFVESLRRHGATVIVSSGRGVQAYWRMRWPVDTFRAKLANEAISKALGGDSCHNPAHPYRLPCTINFPDRRKRDTGCKPAAASLVELTEHTVGFDEVLATFGLSRETLVGLPPASSARLGRMLGPMVVPEPFELSAMASIFPPAAVELATEFVDRDGIEFEHGRRSNGVRMFCVTSARAGVPPGRIAAALTHPGLPLLRAHLEDHCKGTGEAMDVYVSRQVNGAINYVGGERKRKEVEIVAAFPEHLSDDAIDVMARELAADAEKNDAAGPAQPGPSEPAAKPAAQIPRDINERRTIVVDGQTPRIIDEVERKLLASPTGQGIFQRAGQVVRLLRNEAPVVHRGCKLPQDMLRIVPVTAAWLEQRFEAVTVFVRPGKKAAPDGSIVGRFSGCPPKLAERYLANAGSWRLPSLAGIVTAPTLRADGSLLQEPGYDAATGLYFDCGAWTFPAVPAEPTREDALRAIAQLAEPVRSFDFVAEHDRSAWLAAVLTSLLRHSLPTSPLFTFNAPVMGSGKSTLADLVAIIATGHVAPCMTIGGGEDETRKVVLSLLLAGAQLAVLDNIDEPLSSATLASVLTQQSFRGRLLGVSAMLDVPTSCTWVGTGNNLVVEGDLVRRVVPCDLDPRVERPEARRFDFDPREVVRERRGELVVAALTVLRAFEVAGRPGAAALSPFGSFEAWSAAVRAPLVWLGQPDPLLGRERLQQRDPIETSLRRLLQAWHAAFGDRPQTIRQAIQAARTAPLAEATAQAPVGEPEQPQGLVEALAELAGTDRFERESLRIGKQLAKFRGRILDGLQLVAKSAAGGVRAWAVVKDARVGSQGSSGEPPIRQ